MVSKIKQRTRAEEEIRGIGGFFLSIIFFVIYLVWAWCPDDVLHHLGIWYYPDKHWAITLPFYIAFCLFIVPFFYAGVNLLITAPLSSSVLISSSCGGRKGMKEALKKHEEVYERGGISPIYEIPLECVNSRMFPPR